MRRTLFLVLFCTVLLLTACEHIELGEPFDAKVGDKFRIDTHLSISIDSLNDYRCPLLFECFWSGDVKMFCTFYKPFSHIDTALYLINTNNTMRMGGYNFRLLNVDPQSQRGEAIPQKEYRVRIIVQKD